MDEHVVADPLRSRSLPDRPLLHKGIVALQVKDAIRTVADPEQIPVVAFAAQSESLHGARQGVIPARRAGYCCRCSGYYLSSALPDTVNIGCRLP